MHSTDNRTRVRTDLLRLLFTQKACGQSQCAFISAQLAAIAAVPANAAAADVVTAALRSALSSHTCTRACPTQAHVSLCLVRLHERMRSRSPSGSDDVTTVPLTRTMVSPKGLVMVPPAPRQIRPRRDQA